MTDYVKNITFFPTGITELWHYPTIVTMGKAIDMLTIDTLSLKNKEDQKEKFGGYAFFKDFLTNHFTQNIEIKNMHCVNDINKTTDTIHIKDLFLKGLDLSQRRILMGSFFIKKVEYEIFMTKVLYENNYFPLFIVSDNFLVDVISTLKVNNKLAISPLTISNDDRQNIGNSFVIILIDIFEELGRKLDEKNKEGNTFLHLACKNGMLYFSEWLFAMEYIDLLDKNNEGKIPLDLAKEYSDKLKSEEGKIFYEKIKSFHDKKFHVRSIKDKVDGNALSPTQ